MPQSLQDHILEITGKRLRSDDRQKQLKQIAHDISDLDDDDWKRLSPTAQQWYDGVCDQQELDKSAKIKDFMAAGNAASAAPSLPTAKPKSLQEDPVAKKKHNGKSPGKKRVGAPVLIRRWLSKNPKLSTGELYERLMKTGSTASKLFVGATRSVYIATLREQKAAGLLRKGAVPYI